MAEQSELPDWLQAMRPQEESPAGEEAEIPDWVRQMRPREGEPEPVEAEPPPAEEAPAAEPPPAAPAEEAPKGEFAELRRKATPLEVEPEEGPPSFLQNLAIYQVASSLKPWQRFTLSLLVFMNVSALGCFLLMILGRVYITPP